MTIEDSIMPTTWTKKDETIKQEYLKDKYNLADMSPEQIIAKVESGEIPSVSCKNTKEYLDYVNS